MVHRIGVVFHCHAADRGDHRNGDDEEVISRRSRDVRLLPEVAEKGGHRESDRDGDDSDDDGDEETISKSFACHLGVTGTARLRDADGHGHAHPDSEHERQIKDRVGKGRGRKRDDPETPDHERVGESHEHLADLAKDQGKSEDKCAATFGEEGAGSQSVHGRKGDGGTGGRRIGA